LDARPDERGGETRAGDAIALSCGRSLRFLAFFALRLLRLPQRCAGGPAPTTPAARYRKGAIQSGNIYNWRCTAGTPRIASHKSRRLKGAALSPVTGGRSTDPPGRPPYYSWNSLEQSGLLLQQVLNRLHRRMHWHVLSAGGAYLIRPLG